MIRKDGLQEESYFALEESVVGASTPYGNVKTMQTVNASSPDFLYSAAAHVQDANNCITSCNVY